MYTEELISRIYNYKFRKALQFLDGQPEAISSVVRALADMFGDIGWGDGDCNLSTLLDYISRSLIEDLEDLKKEYIICSPCTKASGSEKPVRHLPPECKSKPLPDRQIVESNVCIYCGIDHRYQRCYL